MNILRVIASMDPTSGGPCQGIRNAVPELEKIGIHNEVVCLDAPGAEYLVKDSFVIHAIGPSKGAWQSSPVLIPWLLNNFHRFDAVIIHGLWLYHGYAVTKALRQYRKKNANVQTPSVYVMPHGMLDPYFQKAAGRKIKAFRNWLYWKFIESTNVNTAGGVLFTCEAELLLARQTFSPYKPKLELNVGYGIVLPPLNGERSNNTFISTNSGLSGASYFLFLSRIHEKKGVDILLRAYEEVLRIATIQMNKSLNGAVKSAMKSFPRLVIAGPGLDSPYGQAMIKMVTENESLRDSVVFTGMLSGEVKWGAFNGCEAFILPSHQENFGIAVVEALASGKPVLISNQVNIWKEIEDASAGFVEADTIAGTKRLFEKFLSLDTVEKSAMGVNASSCYQNNFTIHAAAVKFSEALKNSKVHA